VVLFLAPENQLLQLKVMIKEFDLKTNDYAEVATPLFLENLPDKVNEYALNLYRYVYLSNQRCARAKTKTRAMVRGGGKKPFSQKGTGRARAGSIRSPIWRGGGKAHGPDGQANYKLKLNHKFKSFALSHALKQKLDGNDIYTLTNIDPKLNVTPSTKFALKFIDAAQASKSLIIVPTEFKNLYKSFLNIDKAKTYVKLVSEFSVYDVLVAKKLFFVDTPELREFMQKRIR